MYFSRTHADLSSEVISCTTLGEFLEEETVASTCNTDEYIDAAAAKCTGHARGGGKLEWGGLRGAPRGPGIPLADFCLASGAVGNIPRFP